MGALYNPERFAVTPKVDRLFWEESAVFCVGKIAENATAFHTDRYPDATSEGLVYPAVANREWTCSFWTGLLWLAWEFSGEAIFRTTAQGHLPDFRARLDTGGTPVATHDLGFLYTLSSVVAWRLLGDQSARDAGIKAADLLMARYNEKAGVIQAWGDMNDASQNGRIIIDCAMNLPLLFWASLVTGDTRYHSAAVRHLGAANASLIRADWSTYHTFYFDTETGAPRGGKTHQGYADDSCWSRGQAWGIYGNALAYRYLRDPCLLEYGRGLARYFLNRLPEDLVAYWDLAFTDGAEERDSSASAIGACGLLELARHLLLADPERRLFENAALSMMYSLATRYTTKDQPGSNGILLHGVYNKNENRGVDECTIWGDYFYFEALTRITRDWAPYW
jgi:unsaturated chondroitin disaccharide hydrolase